jgi:hypothetical protein
LVQALPLELTALAQAASSLGAPATPAAATAAATHDDASTAASLSHLLLQLLLKAGAAAVAAAPGISSDVQGSVLPAVQALLCPDVSAAARWYPSWALEAAAHQLLEAATADSSSSSSARDADATASSSGCGGYSAAALAQRDNWRLQQAAEVLRQLAVQLTCRSTSSAAAAAAGAGVLASDSAVFASLHAFGLLASVLQARPAAVVDFLTKSSSSSGSTAASAAHADAAAAQCAASALPKSCCAVLTAAVFSLKQRAASALLPPGLLVPLTKAAVSLLMADAQAKLQLAAAHQQQQQAVSVAVQGLLSLLLSPDAQLRLHSAAALVQACGSPPPSSSSSSEELASGEDDESAAASSSGSSVPAWRIVFEGVTSAVLQQQSYTAQQLLPAYQAIAEIVISHSGATEQQQQQQQGLLPVVVQMIVQRLTQWQEASERHQRQDVATSWPNVATSSSSNDSAASLQPLAVERLLLLQLLSGHVLAHCSRQQQPQQQPQQQQSTQTLSSTSAAAPAAHDSTVADATAVAGAADTVLRQVQPALLHLLRMLLPLLQQQDSSSKAGMRHKVSGSCTTQPGPGGWLNYQALLSPSPLLLTWGATQQECGVLFSAGSSSSSSSSGQGVSWLLDPTLEGSRGCRLTQGLPLQLVAAAVDLAHTLLSHGFTQAVDQQGQADTWCSVLCGVIDVKALKPVKKLAKRVLTELAGGSAGYKQRRALHHVQRNAAALLQLLGLDTAADTSSNAAAAVQLQMSWQQQCAAALLLTQLLAVAEAQPSCWARVCSSSSMPQLLPLLLQVAVHCRAQQLCLAAVKLFNLALTGAGVNPKAHSSSSSGSSSSAAESGSTPQAKQVQSTGSSSSSSSSSQKAGQPAVGDFAAAKSSGGSLSLDLSWLQLGVPAAAAAAAWCDELLLSFALRCVLSWPEPKERKEAAKTLVLLHKALEAVNPSGQLQLLQLVLGLLPAAGAAAGAASLQLFATAAHLVKATPAAAAAAAAGSGLSSSSSSTAGVLSSSRQEVLAAAASQLFTTAVAAAGALATHPYAAAYQQLQQLLDLEPIGSSSSSGAAARHWLELSGADVFAAAAAGRPAKRGPSSSSRLANMAAELKFGDRQVCIQCVQRPQCELWSCASSSVSHLHMPFVPCFSLLESCVAGFARIRSCAPRQ